MTNSRCSYCGRPEGKEREHVIPSCLYPDSKNQSSVQRLTIPACSKCNRSWSDDEAHFRSVLLLAGDSNTSVMELWRGKTRRSFEQPDVARRIRDLVEIMESAQVKGEERLIIYPARDPRILRVVKKVVRGLCHHHGIESALPESRVEADILRYRIPEIFVDELDWHHRERDIFEYSYLMYEDNEEVSSAWLLKFFERTSFIAWVFHERRG